MRSRHARGDERYPLARLDPGPFDGACPVVHEDDLDLVAVDCQELEQFDRADLCFKVDPVGILPAPFPEEIRQPHERMDFRGFLHGHSLFAAESGEALTVLDTVWQALGLIAHLDAQVLAIVWLSLRVSLCAVLIGSLISLPLGAWLAIAAFPGRDAIVVFLNGLMGIPSVVVGVVFYLLLSHSGPLGSLGILYSPTAMTLAQVFLVIPLMTALARQIVEDAWSGYSLELRSFAYSPWLCVKTLLFDCRFSLVVAVIAGLGRAISEVGAVMIVGGNILGFTRVMTTAIALETAKGDLPLSIALGTVLMMIVIPLNAVAYGIRRWAMNRFG